MDDLISRKAAIDALEKEKPIPFINKDGSIDPFGAGQQNQWYRDGIAIMNLPSVPRWIPVTERLPEPNETNELGFIRAYLVQDGRWMDVARWDGTYWIAWGYKTVLNNVTAWMPLPKPWKGENDD